MALLARNLSKAFGSRPVLRSVDLEIREGEIHGLVGQNGSGKSTLVKILSGYHVPDPGAELWICGRPVEAGPRRNTSELPIQFVHQDLNLCEEATVLENFLLGRTTGGGLRRIRWGEERRRVGHALDRFGVEVDPDALVSGLSAVERSLLAIVRAVSRLEGSRRGVLVLDEPTATLGLESTSRLFELLRQLADQGLGVLFVSHRVEEIRSLTHRVTVLRDGEVATSAATASLDEASLIEAIIGTRWESLYPTRTSGAHGHREAVVEIASLGAPRVEDLALTLAAGEVVGLTGLAGMGQESIPYTLFGAERATSGTLKVKGCEYDLRRVDPPTMMRAGLALVPANRQVDGSAQQATMRENLTLASLCKRGSWERVSLRKERVAAQRMMFELGVSPPDPELCFSLFSGGNQQKAILAKWLEIGPSLLILHEPTQGVDIGAKRNIFEVLREVSDRGTPLLVVSTEYEDLATLCDRVLVFNRGAVVGELHGSALTAANITAECMRVPNREMAACP